MFFSKIVIQFCFLGDERDRRRSRERYSRPRSGYRRHSPEGGGRGGIQLVRVHSPDRKHRRRSRTRSRSRSYERHKRPRRSYTPDKRPSKSKYDDNYEEVGKTFKKSSKISQKFRKTAEIVDAAKVLTAVLGLAFRLP